MNLRITTDDEARVQLGTAIQKPGNRLLSKDGNPHITWSKYCNEAVLDGAFTALDLEAIVYWMRTYGREE